MNSTSSRKRILTLLTCFIICCTTLNATHSSCIHTVGKGPSFLCCHLTPEASMAVNFTQWFLLFSSAHSFISTRTWAYEQQKKTLIGHSEGRGRKMMEEDLNRGLGSYMFHSQVLGERTKHVIWGCTKPLALSNTLHAPLKAPFGLKALRRTSGSCNSQAELHRDQTARQGRAITQHALLRRAVSHTVLSLAYLLWHCEL